MPKKKLNLEKDTTQILQKLIDLIGVRADAVVTSTDQSTDEKQINLEINTESDPGLLIGSRGSTLNSLQTILTLALRQKYGEWVRVNLDIGDWRKKHEEYLTSLATQAANRALLTGEPQHLYNLTPSQRRTIHMTLSDNTDISTESQGEGENRYLIIKPK